MGLKKGWYGLVGNRVVLLKNAELAKVVQKFCVYLFFLNIWSLAEELEEELPSGLTKIVKQ